jgi:hypothetical protein
MSDLTPLTDEDIAAEQRSDKHRRSKKIDDAFICIMIGFMWLIALIIACGGCILHIYIVLISVTIAPFLLIQQQKLNQSQHTLLLVRVDMLRT